MVVGTPSWVKQGGGRVGGLGDSRARGWGGQGCGYTGREARSCSCVEEVGGGEGGSCLSRGSQRGRDGGTGQARRAASALRDEKLELQEVGACRGSGAAWDRPGEGWREGTGPSLRPNPSPSHLHVPCRGMAKFLKQFKERGSVGKSSPVAVPRLGWLGWEVPRGAGRAAVLARCWSPPCPRFPPSLSQRWGD